MMGFGKLSVLYNFKTNLKLGFQLYVELKLISWVLLPQKTLARKDGVIVT